MTKTDAPVKTLRKAAALMRERAEVASHGPWQADTEGFFATVTHRSACSGEPLPILAIELLGGRMSKTRLAEKDGFHAVLTQEDAEHIASWHPAVALAVASWLEEHARMYEDWEDPNSDYPADLHGPSHDAAVAVAVAYLGEAYRD